MERAHRDRTGPSIALVLIVAGALLLLTNTGLMSWDFWFNNIQLWPFALIALGAIFLFSKRIRVMGVLAVLGLGAVTYLAMPFVTQGQEQASSAIANNTSINVPLENARSVDVSISPSVAKLELSVLQDSPSLIQGSVETRENERLESSFEVQDNGNARYKLESKGKSRWSFNTEVRSKEWILGLNPAVAMDLDVELGVGEAILDLTGLTLTDLNIDSGVGATEVTLPAAGQFDVKIDSGVGAVTLRIPADLAARIDVDRGVSSLSVDSTFEKQDDIYLSSNYETASNRVDIKIDSGVGDIEIIRF